MRSPVRVIVGAVAVALVVAGCGGGDIAPPASTSTTTVSELATARVTLASQQATIASLTARLDAVEAAINDTDYGFGAIQADLVNLGYRVYVLEHPGGLG